MENTIVIDHNIKNGDIVKDFKRELLSEGELKKNPTMYMYGVIETNVIHTETKGELVIYKALYGDGQVYARPKSMFFSKVDKEKYSNIKQEYRLEKIKGTF